MMNRKSAYIALFVLLFASLLTFLLWQLNKNQPNAFKQPAQVISVIKSPSSEEFSPQYQIPSKIDLTVDLITGNTFDQSKPSNLKEEK
jgi:hypothetical protein